MIYFILQGAQEVAICHNGQSKERKLKGEELSRKQAQKEARKAENASFKGCPEPEGWLLRKRQEG